RRSPPPRSVRGPSSSFPSCFPLPDQAMSHARRELQARWARRRGLTAAMAIALGAGWAPARGQPSAPPPAAATPTAPTRTLDIGGCRGGAAEQLSPREGETASTPFTGKSGTLEEVERARPALEKVYTDHGSQTVVVAIPPQTVRGGVVTLKVIEGKVGR